MERERQFALPLAAERISAVVASWSGVTTRQNRCGGIEFRIGRLELGHLCRSIANLPFPRGTRVRLRTSTELRRAIDLFRLNYSRATSKQGGRHAL